jgi:putative restriction endonuclease
LERYGATIIVNDFARKPAGLRVLAFEQSTDCIVYLWTITPGGGGPGVRPSGERRIQITNAPPFPLRPGVRTIVGGWSPETEVWSFWDARRHTRFSSRSPSLQTTLTNLTVAGEDGIAAHVRPATEGTEVTVAVRPDFLLWYIQNGQPLHDADEDASEVQSLIDATPEEERELLDSATSRVRLERRVQLIEIIRAFRDARFRPLVLQAYRNRCAVCSTSLKLVDAAHIIPVSDPRGTDSVTNGIALCRLHHGAYDTGLLGIQSSYRLIINTRTATRLAELQLDGGLAAFRAALPARIEIPNQPEIRPDPHNLRIGLEVRQFPPPLIL